MNLMESLLAQMNRVRSLIPVYRKSSPFGFLTASLMEHDLAAAEKAIGQNDLTAMIKQHEELKEWND